jgi:GIY-YIG catalytic domain
MSGYTLYEIVNLANGKTYVGLTVQPLKRRYAQHLSAAKRGVRHPLYDAMRKHGVENFEIKSIREDAKDGFELQQQEIVEIDRRQSINRANGYNIAPGGQSGRGKTIEVAGRKFHTWAEAASYYGINAATFNLRLSRLGWTPEQAAEIEPAPNRKCFRVVVDGTPMSLRQAAHSIGVVGYKNAHFRVQNGWSVSQAIGIEPAASEKGLHKQVIVEGHMYATLKDAAMAHGLRYVTVHNRIRYQGWTLREALELDARAHRGRQKGISIEAFGQSYQSLTACAKAFGITLQALWHRINELGETVEVAIAHLVRPSPLV